MNRLSKLIDNVIVDEDRNVVGYIDEIIITCRSGQISHIVVKRIDRSRVSIPWADLRMGKQGFAVRGDARRKTNYENYEEKDEIPRKGATTSSPEPPR